MAFSWKSCDGGGWYESNRLTSKGSNEYYRSKGEKMTNSKGLCGYLHETWVIKKDKMRLWTFLWIHEKRVSSFPTSKCPGPRKMPKPK